MATRGDSEGFVSTPLKDKGARPKDSYFPLSDESASELKETDKEYRRVKSDLLRLTRNNRCQREYSRSEYSRSPSPVNRQLNRRSHNLSKFKIAILEDLSRRLKKLETATTKKKNYGHRQNNETNDSKKSIFPTQAKPYVPSNSDGNMTNVLTNNTQVNRPHVPPPTLQQNAAQPTDTVNAQVCYHQTFGDKGHLCSEPCSYYKMIGQLKVANIPSYPAKLLYIDDKRNKCKYLN